MSCLLSSRKRTHSCGELRAADLGKEVVLCGWVWSRRDHGGCVFIDLRDRSGITQVVFRPDVDAGAHALAGELRSEFCIGVIGQVASRGTNVNSKLPTGEIEINASRLEVFSRAETPPFPIDAEIDTNEALRLRYRYLDLRRQPLQRNLMIRSQMYQIAREYFYSKGFLEIETPFMVKYTPGGARNFLVPSRLNPGCFYALAESPQIFKQLFMVAGLERYFQIVRCFRDEDLRLDRQPEFTQIDLELSFAVEEDVQDAVEGMVAALWKGILGIDLPRPFPRMAYDEATERFGTDKPDLRLDLELADVSDQARCSGFQIFEKAVAAGGIVKAMRVPDGEKLSRSMLDSLTVFAKPYGAKGVAFARVLGGGEWQAPFAKAFTAEARQAINSRLGARTGDVLLFVADRRSIADGAMAAIRLHLGEKLGLSRQHEWRFLWLVDMPLFEKTDDGSFVAAHHPFTSPRLADLDILESDPGRCRARAYDLVLNGFEVGGGSIRIHRPDIQARLFKAIGLSNEEARAKFGFLLEAFKYGPPPHGGFAAGLDRLAMLLCGADSLRDVIAFPKTQKGTDLMSDAPTAVAGRQLDEIHIQLKPEAQAKLAAAAATTAASSAASAQGGGGGGSDGVPSS
ncbi:MAG: aspartate--tRNA ligase [Pseudomonadota bacterium]